MPMLPSAAQFVAVAGLTSTALLAESAGNVMKLSAEPHKTVAKTPTEIALLPRILKSLFATWLAFISLHASAHPGGQDRYGCHMNQATGIYHCHKGPLKGRSFGSEAAMLKALKALKALRR